MKRLFAVLLSITLLLGVLPFATVSAAEKETIIIAGSDFQVGGNSTNKVMQLLNTLEIHGITKADAAFFCGDYTPNSVESNTSGLGLQVLKDTFQPLVGNKMVFIQGNHDPDTTPGLSPSGANDPANRAYGAFVINEDQYREWGNDRKDTEAVAANLRKYLQKKYDEGWNVPIFVLCHVQLHWSNRTIVAGSGQDADVLVDVLNEFGAKGMNIFFLYGHNHSGGYDDAMGGAAVYLKKGDTMEVCHGVKREHQTHTLKFTYMNAGFIGYYSTTVEEVDDALTLSVFRIKGNEVIVTRYDTEINLTTGKNGVHNLKSKGAWHPDYSKEGYHVTPDLREYASSRKVTGTYDLPVDAPEPPATTATTTTTFNYANATQSTVNQVSKPTQSNATSPQGSASVQGGEVTQLNTQETDATASEGETQVTDVDTPDDGDGTETQPTDGGAIQDSVTESSSASGLGSIAGLLGIAGGGGILLLLGVFFMLLLTLATFVVVILLVLKRKKKSDVASPEPIPLEQNPEEGNE